MKRLTFLKALNSPFKPFKLNWYAGETQIGVPYFLPRKWVKFTREDAIKEATRAVNDERLVKRSFDEWVEYYKNHTKSVPRKIGFDFCSLGWKTKWDDTDYRFEWDPTLSFVFFGYQIAVRVTAPHNHNYWEAWLYYEINTDKSKSKHERIEQCRREFPQTYKVWHKSKENWETEREEIVDYYDLILRSKYLTKIKQD